MLFDREHGSWIVQIIRIAEETDVKINSVCAEITFAPAEPDTFIVAAAVD